MESTDAEAGMPSAEASGAICVQKLDDSRNSAIHIKYRISLRSSSLREPRYPLLRVVRFCGVPIGDTVLQQQSLVSVEKGVLSSGKAGRGTESQAKAPSSETRRVPPHMTLSSVFAGHPDGPGPARVGGQEQGPEKTSRTRSSRGHTNYWVSRRRYDRFNDPSAGSPTETLLRLLLPLDGRV